MLEWIHGLEHSVERNNQAKPCGDMLSQANHGQCQGNQQQQPGAHGAESRCRAMNCGIRAAYRGKQKDSQRAKHGYDGKFVS